MTNDPKNPPLSPGEMALTQIGAMGTDIPVQIQELITALQMRKVMEGVVGDVVGGRGYKAEPSSMIPAEPSRPSLAGPSKARNGWLPETKAESPPGQDLIAAQCDAALPHGLGNPAHPLAKVVEEVVQRFKAQQAEKGENPKNEALSICKTEALAMTKETEKNNRFEIEGKIDAGDVNGTIGNRSVEQ